MFSQTAGFVSLFFFSFLWLNSVCVHVCVSHIFFIHSSINRHLGCFHTLNIVNNAAIIHNMETQISKITISFCFDRQPEVRLLYHMLLYF